ncbi:hypothetical protein [Longimicrobium sp.]|uniref:hypothetical protein n=1 Tax=Longimicrobium sp. TaxID=2029185 RepID=UPI002E2FDD2D|nr:hypothetical protein [Longimicrobium sp.]HEX6036925.1 hypothetical protein [Longimicrobium sp.]
MHLLTYMRSAGVLALLLSGVACGKDTPPRGDVEAGRHGIIRNDDRENVPRWTISPQPLVDIGGREDQALVMVTAGVVHGDEIIVADGGAVNLRWFDRAGRVLRTVGERGSGPGQFQFMGWMGLLPGDSVAVWDPSLRRLSIFDAAGKLGRMTTLRFTRGPLPPVLGAFGDGTLLVADAGAPARSVPPGTAWRDTLVYLRVASNGEIADTLGRFPGAEWYVAAGASGRVHSLPFGRQTVAAVRGNSFYVGHGDLYEVAAFTADGTERVRFGRPFQPVNLAPQDIDAYQSTLVHMGGTPEERRERAREVREAPYPRSLPPYLSLQVDARGNIWVREPDSTGELYAPSHWSVFDSTGRWIATAQGPGRFKVLQIGPDWVLGTVMDADDVAHVGFYKLVRREPNN